jgi:DNA-directed RNA polymerase sigma subunit (sigma70/sigma32)
MSVLKNRDRAIIEAYFGINREYASATDMIAEDFGMTNVRVCQIVKSAIQKMKEVI